MIPEEKTYTVTVTYWACNCSHHRHRSQRVAEACIARKKKSEGRRQWSPQQRSEILSRFRAGLRQSDLAKELGLSKERVRQIIAKAEREERYSKEERPFSELSERTRNALLSEGIRTREQVLDLLKSGKLLSVYQIGAAANREIRAWLAR